MAPRDRALSSTGKIPIRALPRVSRGVALVGVLLNPTLLHAQDSLARRVDQLLDTPPFDRASWGVFVADEDRSEYYARSRDRLFIPGSNIKLVVAAAASALLPESYRITTSVYGTGPLRNGVLAGDLVVYGRGDPTFSTRCYDSDTLAAGACDAHWERIGVMADSIVSSGVRHVAGSLVGDGSFFTPPVVHPAWEGYDLTWWYATPVSALGFNDNSVKVTWAPGPAVNAPAVIQFEAPPPNFEFENRSRTVPADGARTLDFFWTAGAHRLRAEGAVPIGYRGKTEYLAFPDPDLLFARALRAALAERGVSVGGPTSSTTDSLRYRGCRQCTSLVDFTGRPLGDVIFAILNPSQNWFAEMLLKVLAREFRGVGTWENGLDVLGEFLIDSVGIDSTAFDLTDGSGLATGNLMTPRALVELLRYMLHHPNNGAFMRALPRAGEPGSLRTRFTQTPLAGRVVAKTGTMSHVNALSGYIERPDGNTLVFSVMANNHIASYNAVVAQIDAVIVEIGRLVGR